MYGVIDCTVRERDCPFLKGLHRYFVAELSTQLVELVGLELVHRDQLPIAVSGRNRDPAVSAFPERVVGSACALSFSRLARRSLALRPAHSRWHQFVTR